MNLLDIVGKDTVFRVVEVQRDSGYSPFARSRTRVVLEAQEEDTMDKAVGGGISVDMSGWESVMFGSAPKEVDKDSVKPELTFYNDEKEVVTLKFKDGTVVQASPTEDDEYSREFGFLAALGRYIYGSRSALVKAIDAGKVQE